jgi:hypothetical protein
MPPARGRWLPRFAGILCVLLTATAVPSSAGADDVVASLTRGTPISAFGGALAWSYYDAATDRYALVVQRGGRSERAPVANAGRPFDVSLGPDVHGRVVGLYTRCRRATTGCDVYRYDVASRRERKVAAVSSPDMDEAWPAQWRDRVTFVRRARTYVMSGYDHRPDPRGKRGGGVLMDCDVPYVRTLSPGGRSRRLDRSQCGTTTGMSIRAKRIVQVSSEDQGGAGSEAQVRLLRATGGAARILARAGGGEGGYSPFASASQSASAVYLTRTGNRRPHDFLRIDLRSARLTALDPHLPLAGRVTRDERGRFWYVQGPEPDENGDVGCPLRTSAGALQPCRLVRASSDPFGTSLRVLVPRLTLSGTDRIHGLYTDALAISGDLRRDVVAQDKIVRRLPVAGVQLELVRNRPSPTTFDTPFEITGASMPTDALGHWSFPLHQPPALARIAVVARELGLATGAVDLSVDATVTLKAVGGSLTGTVAPPQPGRGIVIERAAGVDPVTGPTWTRAGSVALSADGTAFSTPVVGAGFYRATLPPDPNAGSPLAHPDVYFGVSAPVQVSG